MSIISGLDHNSGISLVQVALPNQHSLAHPTIINSSPGVQTIHVTAIADESVNYDSKKRREILARRPSYRKILNELSSHHPAPLTTIDKIEEESNSSQDEEEPNLNAVQYPSVPQTIHIAGHNPDGQPIATGLQTLTMTNASNTSPGTTPGATIVQYAQGPDGQFYIPVAGGGVQAYQLASATSLTPSVMMAQPSSGMSSPVHGTEEVSRKRELRLLKNREAACECRRKKKEYVKCLENRVEVLENQNKTLIEELKALKELYCQQEG